MPDREKRERIIEALKRCEKDECNGCPYDGECDKRPFAVDRDAAGLLMAIKPIDTGNQYYVCGECKMPVLNDWVACPYCGREIKWNA